MEEGVIEGGSLDADPDPPGGPGGLQGIGTMPGRELDRGFDGGFTPHASCT